VPDDLSSLDPHPTADAKPAAAPTAAAAGTAAMGSGPVTPGRDPDPEPDHEVDIPLDGHHEPEAQAPVTVSAAPADDTNAADRTRAGEDADVRIDELNTVYPSARPGPAGAIHGVGITVLVTDLARSTAFYRDVLGFFEIDNGGGSAVLASGDTRLVLRTVHELSPATGRLIYLNLEVGDVDGVHDELRAKGVTFVHGPRAVNRGDRLELLAASFHDPDGHNIAVTQWRSVS
jgi:catechol 2,3-dioxygenase-like lactoylglutathione lyase family enzyme